MASCLNHSTIAVKVLKNISRSPNGESATLRLNSELFDEFPFLTKMPVTIRNGYYVFAKSAEGVLRIDEITGSTKFTDLGVTEESNPVIFYYHLKES